MIGLPCGEETVMRCQAISIQYRNVTDRQTELLYQYCTSVRWRAIKNLAPGPNLE